MSSDPKKKESAAKAEEKIPKAPPVKMVKTKKLRIRNLLYQKIVLNITPPGKSPTSVEIGQRGIRDLPWEPSLGPDIESKKTKGFISVTTIEV